MYIYCGDRHLKSKHFSILSIFHLHSKSSQYLQHSVVNLKFINFQILRTYEMYLHFSCRSVNIKQIWHHHWKCRESSKKLWFTSILISEEGKCKKHTVSREIWRALVTVQSQKKKKSWKIGSLYFAVFNLTVCDPVKPFLVTKCGFVLLICVYNPGTHQKTW